MQSEVYLTKAGELIMCGDMGEEYVELAYDPFYTRRWQRAFIKPNAWSPRDTNGAMRVA